MLPSDIGVGMDDAASDPIALSRARLGNTGEEFRVDPPKVDRALHEQVLKRYEVLKIAPYAGFINPRLVPVMKGEEIVDVKVEYPDDFVEQMLEYGEKYRRLPVVN